MTDRKIRLVFEPSGDMWCCRVCNDEDERGMVVGTIAIAATDNLKLRRDFMRLMDETLRWASKRINIEVVRAPIEIKRGAVRC